MLGIGLSLWDVARSGSGLRSPSPMPASLVIQGYAPEILPLRAGAAAQLSIAGYSVACAPIPTTAELAITGNSVACAPIPAAAGLEIAGYAPEITGGETVTWGEWISGLTETQVIDFDFTQTDRNFQDITGETLADDAGETIALALDSGVWGGNTFAAFLANQPENLTNTAFDTSDGWTLTSGASISGGQVVFDGVTSFPANTNMILDNAQFSPTVNRIYRVSFDITSSTTRPIAPLLGGAAATGTFSQRAYSALLKATSTVRLSIIARFDTGARTGGVDNISIKVIPGAHGQQTTTSYMPKRQAGGVCRYDGSDDNHLTTFVAQNGAMTMLYQGTVPASLSATQMLLGASGSSAYRCWLGITTAGFIAAGVGNQSTATIVGTADVRGSEIVAAATFDGSTVKLFLRVDGVVTEEYSAAQDGTPTTAIPFRIGAYNNNGTAAGFASVDAKRVRAAHKAMSLSEFTQIAAEMAA